MSNCGGDNACANSCRVNHPCGAQSPQRVNTTASVSSTSSTSLPTDVVYKGFGSGSATAQQTGKSAATSIRVVALSSVGQTFGSLAVIGGLFAGFAIML